MKVYALLSPLRISYFICLVIFVDILRGKSYKPNKSNTNSFTVSIKKTVKILKENSSVLLLPMAVCD